MRWRRPSPPICCWRRAPCPSMTIAPRRSADFVARADALLVNLGTFDAERRAAAGDRRRGGQRRGKPWVLDPVFIDRSPPRAAFAATLVAAEPRAIRCNRAEFEALAGVKPEGGALAQLRARHGAVVGLTGADRPRDRRRPARRDRQWRSADGARSPRWAARLRRWSRPPRGRDAMPGRATAAALLLDRRRRRDRREDARPGPAVSPSKCSMRSTGSMPKP